MALGLAFGIAGALAANAVRMPLAWMLGALMACAGGALAGLSLRPLPYSRELAQAVVGLAIGVRFTPDVLAATASLLPAMLLATLFLMAVTMAAALLMKPLGGVDRKTAFFATAAAGVAEMAIIARERGGDPDAVSIVQAIRVAVIVTLVPILVVTFGADGGVGERSFAGSGNPVLVAGALALGIAAAAGLRRVPGFPNAWVFGPLLVGALISSIGGTPLAVSWPLLVVAQLALGVALGCRFDRARLGRLPRVAASGLGIALLLILAASIGAAVLSASTGLSYATSFLALAPAGVTEMVLTARVMHLDTVSVTAFHVVRIAVIAATIIVSFGVFERLSRWMEGPSG
jgi:membrane AbrB-like protein